MTEAEWLGCTDPATMLEFLRGKASDRKLRLFAVACCRRMWHLLADEQSRNAVNVAERLADGQATRAERRSAAVAGYDQPAGGAAAIGWQAASCVVGMPAQHAAVRTSENAASALGRASTTIQYTPTYGDNAAYFAAVSEVSSRERVAQAPLLRDIFGNPFRPSPPLPRAVLAWNDPTVRRIAEGIYEERRLPEGTLDSGRLAILSDALLDAGCDNEELIAHLRSPGPHVRGCWAIDLLTGRE